jgi:hypothetical protein
MAFWGVSRKIESGLRDLLASVEAQEPSWVLINHGTSSGLVDLSGTSVQMLDWAIKDNGPWAIRLTFSRSTEDGKLETEVYSEDEKARVSVNLNPGADKDVIHLKSFGYVSWGGGTQTQNKAAVEYIREWVRCRCLAELKAEKARRESASSQRAAEIDALRRKYLP